MSNKRETWAVSCCGSSVLKVTTADWESSSMWIPRTWWRHGVAVGVCPVVDCMKINLQCELLLVVQLAILFVKILQRAGSQQMWAPKQT